MIKEKEMLLDKVIAVFGYEHKKTILFAEMLEIASDDKYAIDFMTSLADQIIKRELNEREEDENV